MHLHELQDEIEQAQFDAMVSIDSTVNAQIHQIKSEAIEISDSTLKDNLKNFEIELKTIIDEVNRAKAEVENSRTQRERVLLDLPQFVTLDDLYERYKKSKGVSFETEKGTLYFISYQIEIAIVPSLNKPAWIRIGKKKSEDNPAAIKAWLRESEREKTRQGYYLVSNSTNPSDYGEYTERIYKKGDMYFKTYYQYIRTQGTYNSLYYQYSYYVETGSSSRKAQYVKEQYNNKLGS
ncbi:MAG: hypothetical protein ACTSVY_11540 [Candidatus Helarchaeota archaeon]